MSAEDYVNWDHAKEFIGVKRVSAMLMCLGTYNAYRGWTIPEDEDPNDIGYIVKYPDGYISWCPRTQFEESNRLSDGMSFGMAIEAMKMGFKVARAGWNGKGMFCIYVPGSNNVQPSLDSPYELAMRNTTNANQAIEILPHFDMYTVDVNGRRAFLPGWLASQSDMNAEDWCVV